jgi:hypothetical protein
VVFEEISGGKLNASLLGCDAVDIPAVRAVRGGVDDVGLRAGVVGHGPVPVRAPARRRRAAHARAVTPQLHTRLHQELRSR